MGWLDAFGISALRNRSFVKLSSGEQRLLLLARALVKDRFYEAVEKEETPAAQEKNSKKGK